jgi:transposase
MSARRTFAPWCFEGSLDGDKMVQWLQQLRPQLHENHVLILDNATPHHSRKVREYLAEHPIQILFLPPYSPHMNPIEKLWAAIKQQWRQRRVQGFPQLQATLEADLQQIVTTSGRAMVANCGYGAILS